MTHEIRQHAKWPRGHRPQMQQQHLRNKNTYFSPGLSLSAKVPRPESVFSEVAHKDVPFEQLGSSCEDVCTYSLLHSSLTHPFYGLALHILL